jgi:hypothetical protein
MKHFFLASFFVLAACKAAGVNPELSDAENALLKSAEPAAAAPQTFETREKTVADQAEEGNRSQGNSYDQTCGPVRLRFEASNPMQRFAQRLAEAANANRLTGGALPAGATPATLTPPIPVLPDLGDERVSAVCFGVLDLDAGGVPANVETVCSDARFEASMSEALASARFEPVKKNGQPVAYKGVVHPMEICFSD